MKQRIKTNANCVQQNYQKNFLQSTGRCLCVTLMVSRTVRKTMSVVLHWLFPARYVKGYYASVTTEHPIHNFSGHKILQSLVELRAVTYISRT